MCLCVCVSVHTLVRPPGQLVVALVDLIKYYCFDVGPSSQMGGSSSTGLETEAFN